jgi:hypothetical protein
MSLTDFLQLEDVKTRFRTECSIPRLPKGRELLAPPRSPRFMLVGTAFDYLLRWEIKRRNPGAIERPWVAEAAPVRMTPIICDRRRRGVQANSPIPSPEEWQELLTQWQELLTEKDVTNMRRTWKAQDILAQAKAAEAAYLSTGVVTGELLASSIMLAQLDQVYRRGDIPEDPGVVHDEDVEDLRQLLAIVPPDLFHASRLCVLNPTFGKASSKIGGADADLVIDETLIEIKTTKTWAIRSDYIFQLVGYYLLSTIGGIDGVPAGGEISRLGIYFSRFGYMFTAGVEEIIRPKTLPAFRRWFRRRITAYREDIERRTGMHAALSPHLQITP